MSALSSARLHGPACARLPQSLFHAIPISHVPARCAPQTHPCSSYTMQLIHYRMYTPTDYCVSVAQGGILSHWVPICTLHSDTAHRAHAAHSYTLPALRAMSVGTWNPHASFLLHPHALTPLLYGCTTPPPTHNYFSCRGASWVLLRSLSSANTSRSELSVCGCAHIVRREVALSDYTGTQPPGALWPQNPWQTVHCCSTLPTTT